MKAFLTEDLALAKKHAADLNKFFDLNTNDMYTFAPVQMEGNNIGIIFRNHGAKAVKHPEGYVLDSGTVQKIESTTITHLGDGLYTVGEDRETYKVLAGGVDFEKITKSNEEKEKEKGAYPGEAKDIFAFDIDSTIIPDFIRRFFIASENDQVLRQDASPEGTYWSQRNIFGGDKPNKPGVIQENGKRVIAAIFDLGAYLSDSDHGWEEVNEAYSEVIKELLGQNDILDETEKSQLQEILRKGMEEDPITSRSALNNFVRFTEKLPVEKTGIHFKMRELEAQKLEDVALITREQKEAIVATKVAPFRALTHVGKDVNGNIIGVYEKTHISKVEMDALNELSNLIQESDAKGIPFSFITNGEFPDCTRYLLTKVIDNRVPEGIMNKIKFVPTPLINQDMRSELAFTSKNKNVMIEFNRRFYGLHPENCVMHVADDENLVGDNAKETFQDRVSFTHADVRKGRTLSKEQIIELGRKVCGQEYTSYEKKEASRASARTTQASASTPQKPATPITPAAAAKRSRFPTAPANPSGAQNSATQPTVTSPTAATKPRAAAAATAAISTTTVPQRKSASPTPQTSVSMKPSVHSSPGTPTTKPEAAAATSSAAISASASAAAANATKSSPSTATSTKNPTTPSAGATPQAKAMTASTPASTSTAAAPSSTPAKSQGETTEINVKKNFVFDINTYVLELEIKGYRGQKKTIQLPKLSDKDNLRVIHRDEHVLLAVVYSNEKTRLLTFDLKDNHRAKLHQTTFSQFSTNKFEVSLDVQALIDEKSKNITNSDQLLSVDETPISDELKAELHRKALPEFTIIEEQEAQEAHQRKVYQEREEESLRKSITLKPVNMFMPSNAQKIKFSKAQDKISVVFLSDNGETLHTEELTGKDFQFRNSNSDFFYTQNGRLYKQQIGANQEVSTNKERVFEVLMGSMHYLNPNQLGELQSFKVIPEVYISFTPNSNEYQIYKQTGFEEYEVQGNNCFKLKEATPCNVIVCSDKAYYRHGTQWVEAGYNNGLISGPARFLNEGEKIFLKLTEPNSLNNSYKLDINQIQYEQSRLPIPVMNQQKDQSTQPNAPSNSSNASVQSTTPQTSNASTATAPQANVVNSTPVAAPTGPQAPKIQQSANAFVPQQPPASAVDPQQPQVLQQQTTAGAPANIEQTGGAAQLTPEQTTSANAVNHPDEAKATQASASSEQLGNEPQQEEKQYKKLAVLSVAENPITRQKKPWLAFYNAKGDMVSDGGFNFTDNDNVIEIDLSQLVDEGENGIFTFNIHNIANMSPGQIIQAASLRNGNLTNEIARQNVKFTTYKDTQPQVPSAEAADNKPSTAQTLDVDGDQTEQNQPPVVGRFVISVSKNNDNEVSLAVKLIKSNNEETLLKHLTVSKGQAFTYDLPLLNEGRGSYPFDYLVGQDNGNIYNLFSKDVSLDEEILGIIMSELNVIAAPAQGTDVPLPPHEPTPHLEGNNTGTVNPPPPNVNNTTGTDGSKPVTTTTNNPGKKAPAGTGGKPETQQQYNGMKALLDIIIPIGDPKSQKSFVSKLFKQDEKNMQTVRTALETAIKGLDDGVERGINDPKNAAKLEKCAHSFVRALAEIEIQNGKSKGATFISNKGMNEDGGSLMKSIANLFKSIWHSITQGNTKPISDWYNKKPIAIIWDVKQFNEFVGSIQSQDEKVPSDEQKTAAKKTLTDAISAELKKDVKGGVSV